MTKKQMVLGLLIMQAYCQQPSPAQLAAQAVAPTQERFACTEPGCKKNYSFRQDLTRHVKIAHLNMRVPCTEPGCKQTFITAQVRNAHINNIHRGIRHQCPYCPASYTQQSRLYLHTEAIHANNPLCECKICHQKFLVRFDYDRHLQTEAHQIAQERYRDIESSVTRYARDKQP